MVSGNQRKATFISQSLQHLRQYKDDLINYVELYVGRLITAGESWIEGRDIQIGYKDFSEMIDTGVEFLSENCAELEGRLDQKSAIFYVSTNNVAQGANVRVSAGTYEVELNWEGQSGLHKLKKHCQKHRGHDKFILSQQFDEQHLPAHYKEQLIVDLVRCLSTLTVQLTVDKISTSRPPPPYPPSLRWDNLGRDCPIAGTGHVSSAVVCPEGEDNCCACSECLNSGSPERRFGKIFIQTAAHVVHDDSEAANTTCYFNYVNDSDGLDTAIKIRGAKGVQIDVKEDRCWMFCYTHDLSLVKKLESALDDYRTLRREVAEKYRVNWADTPEHKLTIIVSHPHGCCQYITVGNIEGRTEAADDADWTQYTYTTPTCPGSSGAPIFILGKQGYIDNHHHSGTKDGLNISTFGLF